MKRSKKKIDYPDPSDKSTLTRTFQIRYDKKLSSVAKFLLTSFNKKYLYYAIDDILYLFQLNPSERDNLLAILYSPVLSLQNNFSVDFFDIWIDRIYIQKTPKVNKFLKTNSSNFQQYSYITIKFLYKMPILPRKPDSLW